MQTATPPTTLSKIVPRPRRFVKAVPPSSRILNTNADRSSSSSTLQEDSTGSEEASAVVEDEASSLSESGQSTENIQSDANRGKNALPNTGHSSVSGEQDATKPRWEPKKTPHQRKLDALKKKRLDPKLMPKREMARSMPRGFQSDLKFSSSPESSPSMAELSHSLAPPTNINKPDPSHRNKKTLGALIPKRLIEKLKHIASPDAAEPLVDDETTDANTRNAFGKSLASTLKSLHKSELYKNAEEHHEAKGTLLTGVLESYLSSLLKDEKARDTIEKWKLTADGAVAIRWYGREGFQYVQPSLRKKPDPALISIAVAEPGTFKHLVKACESAFAKLPALPRGTALFRGTNFLFDENLKPGDVYTDPAFVSTSKLKEVTEVRFPGRYLLKFVNIPDDDHVCATSPP